MSTKKLCKYPKEKYARDCPHSTNHKILRCTWNDEGCPRYEKKPDSEESENQ